MDSDEDDGGRRLLGFMFGNVDASGDVDADHLDEDAREYLAALAYQLGPSLADLELVDSPSGTAEQGLGGAEEGLVDHGDDDEEVRNGGREAEAETAEEDFPFPNRERSAPVGYFLDEEDYDADDDGTAMETTQVAVDDPPSGSPNRGEYSDDGGDLPSAGNLGKDVNVRYAVEGIKGEPVAVQESAEPGRESDLPVLCIENGMEILRFSEIFGVHVPLKKVGRRESHRNKNGKANHVETEGVVDAVEDDEACFLKRACRGAAVTRHLSSVEGDCVELRGVDVGSVVGEYDRDSCLSGQPMKERMAWHPSPRWREPDCWGFCPLDQQDWEDKIVWGSSPAASHGSSRSCVLSEHDSDTGMADDEVGVVVSSECSGPRPQVEPDVDHSLVSLAVSEEPSVSQGIPEPACSQCSLGLRGSQPHILRLDSCLKGGGLEATNVKSTRGVEGLGRDGVAQCLKKISLQNKDLLDGRWLDQIIWDPGDPIPKPKLVLDLQDEQMSFETFEPNHIGQVSHADALIAYYPLQTPLGDSFGRSNQHGLPIDGFNISNDEFYTDWVTGQQSKSCAKRRANHFAKVIHSAPALKLQTMKPKLSNKEIANFHRPKALWYPRENRFASKMQGTLCTQGSIRIILKSLGGKRIKLHLDVQETMSSIKSRLSKKLDFKLPEKVKIFYSGKELEDDKSLALQDVKPNSLLHIVRSKIHVCSPLQLLTGDNESLCPPGAFRRRSDLSLRDGHVFLMEYCEERPLLLGNIGMSARLCTYYKLTLDNVTDLPPQSQHDVLGNVFTLDSEDESPFLGEVHPGCSQPSLENNMYRAPLFPHELSTTDYLLVRSANGMLSLRRINKIYVVGQQEPHVKVISPGVRGVQNYNSKRLLVHVYREFYRKQKSGLCPYIRADELSLQFPSLAETFLRKRLKHCAYLQRRLNGRSFWVKKPGFQIPSEQDIRRILAPEDVCCYESMQAGLYRLKQLGISSLTHPICLSHNLSQPSYEAVTIATASLIERELLITPWNVSSSFVACVNQGVGNTHYIEITGAGDPSGCGLGFSYIRATWPAPRFPLFTLSMSKRKKVSAVRVGSTSARADTDFHGPSIGTAFDNLSKLNFYDRQPRKITGFDRNATVHRLSSEQAASNFRMDTTTISNSQRPSYLLLCQQARRKCQEIWNRQVQSLSSADVNENESSPKGGSDLDPFAVDLENLLDVEEFGEGEHNLEHRNEIAGVYKGQQMGRHVCHIQREEENEDEEAEAALMSAWLDGDDNVRIMKDGKVKQVTKGSSTSKEIVQNNELQRIPVEKNLCLNLKVAYKGDDVHAGLATMQNKAVEDGQEIIDKKELTDKPRRQIFACGACSQMGHMKTNKICPKYREELGASEVENVLAKTNLIEAGTQIPFQTSSNKLLRLEISERSDKSGIDAPRRTLQLKFKYVLADKHQQNDLPGPPCSDRWLTPKEETDTKSFTKLNEITATSCNTKAEDEEEPVQKSPLVSRLSTRQKIRFKPPKNVNNVEQGRQGGGMEEDDEFTKARKISKLASLEEEKQPSVQSTEETMEHRGNFSGKRKDMRRWQKRDFGGLQGGHHLELDAEKQKETTHKREKRKSKPVSISSYSKEYKTSRQARRMHDRDQAAKGQPIVGSGCHVAEHSLLIKCHRGGEVLLSNILENVVSSLGEHNQISYLFMKPVSKKEAPDYLDIIKHPMDLSTIKEKVRRMEYKSRKDFRRDVWQINFNAHRYNDGRNPGIAFLADQLLEICDHLLSQNSAILTEAEAGI